MLTLCNVAQGTLTTWRYKAVRREQGALKMAEAASRRHPSGHRDCRLGTVAAI